MGRITRAELIVARGRSPPFAAFGASCETSERSPNAAIPSLRAMKVHRRLALAAVLLGVVVTSLDNTVVNVALPSIARALHTGIAGCGWVVDAYLLAFATLLL